MFPFYFCHLSLPCGLLILHLLWCLAVSLPSRPPLPLGMKGGGSHTAAGRLRPAGALPLSEWPVLSSLPPSLHALVSPAAASWWGPA